MRLLLLRHAKSAWPDGMSDADRPLGKRGREAAPRLGAYLAAENLQPDLTLLSPARRARETWDLVRPHLGAVPVRMEARVYEATAIRLLTVVREVDDAVRTLLIVGHNPGMEDLARQLAGEGDAEGLARLREKYPTAGLAVLGLDAGSWSTVDSGSAHLERFVTPKSLGHGEDE